MRRLLFILCLPSLAFAGGPKSTYPQPRGLDSEMQNIYHDIANPIINIGSASTMTVTYLNISTITAISESVSGTLTTKNLVVNGGTVSGISGRIIQYVTATTAATDSTTSTTFQSSSLTLSITPSSASNAILLLAMSNAEFRTNNDVISLALFRGTTQLGTGSTRGQNAFGNFSFTSGNPISPFTLIYVDSPNTTSATTYTVKYHTDVAGRTVVINDVGTDSYIIAMEISQ